MSDIPLISVVMPAFNSEKYVAIAIQSILNQTYTNFELIIYEDGSSDGTRKVIEEFRDPKIVKLFSDVNLGVVAARNAILDIARGEYIALMDADDIAHPRRLEKQLSQILKNNLDICGSSQFILNQKSGKIKKSQDKFTDSDLRALLTVYCPLCNSTIMGKANIFKQFKYDPSLTTSEDYYLWARIAAAGYIFGNIKDRLVTYRVYPEQATALYPMKFRESTIQVQVKYLELLGIPPNLRPTPHSFSKRRSLGLLLLKNLRKRFPRMSFMVTAEIYSRFQGKGGIVRSILNKAERIIIVSTVFLSALWVH